ncbi:MULTISPECIES: MmgE/PrpD family protein [Streptomyces]|uniref:MmgE/PrpD family protein n=1 Tax=Streptomyces TaxID=1883 RepID=UPI001CC915B4|nr:MULTISPECIES: MmgE/PrpD family protein [Streptomyces]MBZ6247788.1 MmgE/PrpD family protein [Streptomyces olivaceus]MCU8595630.1 MmgE/PrpD family protein [Streptomyces sp. A13(2022)]
MTAREQQIGLAQRVGRFAAGLTLADIPEEVAERARHLILDAVGLAFVSADRDFAEAAAAALGPDSPTGSAGAGNSPVLGRPERLEARDAAVLNGVLVHGLDFDDTHIAAVTHVTASALPAALAAAVRADRGGDELLAAYVLGVEVAARVGLGGAGHFHDSGYHPTAVAGAFGAATVAAKLGGLDADGIATAQGIVGSMAAGLLEFLEDGSWTKRLHPGWAAMSGLTAASFARVGWSGPPAVYEGRFGLYSTHLQTAERPARPEAVAEGLGEVWELARTAVKPYASCHFTHPFVDSALLLRREGAAPARITRVTAGIHPVPGKVIAEPLDAKRTPVSEYDAKFSLPFTVAAAFVRDRFGLAELSTEARQDADILALARRIEVVDDPESAFPGAYSGVLTVELDDGRVLTHREQVNRGHDTRPLTNADVVAKFRENMAACADADDAVTARVESAVLELGKSGDHSPTARQFAEACSSAPR